MRKRYGGWLAAFVVVTTVTTWSVAEDMRFGVVIDPAPDSGTTPRYECFWKGVQVTEVMCDRELPGGASERPQPQVRVSGNTPAFGWAAPVEECDSAFSSIDIGFSGNPVVYEIDVEKGGEYRLVFGVCEGHHEKPGSRILNFVVEGRQVGTLDTLRDGRNVPMYECFDVADTDGDGMLRVEVGTTENSPDRNSILNALWLLPRVWLRFDHVSGQWLPGGDARPQTRETLLAEIADRVIVRHNASTRTADPLYLKLQMQTPESAEVGPVSPVFVVESAGPMSVSRNGENDYTLCGELRVKFSGVPVRLRSIVNRMVEFQYAPFTPGVNAVPAVEFTRGFGD